MSADFKPSALPSCMLMAAAIALSAGCGGDPFQRQPIKGVASFAGKPIKFGTVRFEPAEKQPAGTSASIKDGEFKVERAAGIGPGKYKVWVQAFDRSGEVAAGAAPGSEGPPPKDILPAKYLNEPATEFTVNKVTDDKPNEVNLDLK